VTVKSPGGNGHSRMEDEGADLRRYLLGQMSESEAAQVERAFLASDDALEELRAREDELIEDYLAGALEPQESDRFERLFLASPSRLERLVFVRALHDRAAGPPGARVAPARGPRRLVRVALALGVVVVAGWLAARALGPRPAAVETPLPVPLVADAPIARAAAPAPASVTLRLRRPALRGPGEVPLLDLGLAERLALEAPLDPRDGFAAHRGRVVAPDGREVFVSPWQPNRGEPLLRVVLPSSSLREGRHVLVVEGRAGTAEEPVESYGFRVRPR
jgi:hypothetical protein